MSKKLVYDSDQHLFRMNHVIGRNNQTINGYWTKIPGKGWIFAGSDGNAYTAEDPNGNFGNAHRVNLSDYDRDQIQRQVQKINQNRGAGVAPAPAVQYLQALLRPAPKTAAPKTAAPKTAAPKTAAPKTAAPKTAAPKTAAPKTAAPKTAAVHSATYNPITGATGAYAVSGWLTNAWGGGKRKVLDADIAQKLGLNEGATAQDAQNFLKSKGYGISTDNYWGKQSLAAFDDYINRGNVSASTINAPELNQKASYGSYNPATRQYEATANNGITSGQLRRAGITNFKGYQSFMNNKANATNGNSGIYNFLNGVRQSNSGVDFNNEDQFNKFYGTSGHYGRHDRNNIISAGARSYDTHPTYTSERNDYGKLYDALNNSLSEDQKNKGKISWVTSNNKQIPVYLGNDGTYYKQGDDGKLTQTGTYTMGNDGKYFVSFRLGGSLNKYQQGGVVNMDEQADMQQAFLQYLAEQTGAKSQEELEQIIQQLGEDGLKQAYALFMQAMQELQVQAAKFGAKLNYIRSLNGKCPAGTQMLYYKVGGKLCKKCMQIEKRGGRVKGNIPTDAIQDFKNRRKH